MEQFNFANYLLFENKFPQVAANLPATRKQKIISLSYSDSMNMFLPSLRSSQIIFRNTTQRGLNLPEVVEKDILKQFNSTLKTKQCPQQHQQVRRAQIFAQPAAPLIRLNRSMQQISQSQSLRKNGEAKEYIKNYKFV
ncbi:hypothetical protein SS50377_28440 [Spironucleus salmonicida]|uniref:Uncharacterized protein n=1 Tax=Spironucleus salmonicida TaxID=348837 RepID=V6LFE5_9EUKA|nr:hypothetical protein SS50377_28440 [Spironucleus salmonicida]|eukprot:EST43212.1 Hypothetical protein SS50377_17156 [Spironucleus salmonicida]